MTFDIVALCARQPDLEALLSALLSTGPELKVNFTDENVGVIQIFHPEGRFLMSIEAACLIQVPGEVERLLGTEATVPVWWVESRALGADAEAEAAARRFTSALVAVTGGSSWSNR